MEAPPLSMTVNPKRSPMESRTMTCVLWIVALTTAVGIMADSSLLTSEPGRHVFTVKINQPGSSTGSCPDFPATLQVDIPSASGPFPQSLVLYRKDVINTEVPVYVLKSDENGLVYTERVDSDGEKTAAYQSEDFGAAFFVKCTDEGSFRIAGTMFVEGHKYRVRHHQSDLTSSWEMATSYYEFSYVNDTYHNDDRLQGKRSRPIEDSPNSDLSPDRSRSSRAKRDSTQDYYIDVLVALDYAFYKYWLKRAGNENSTEAIREAKEYVAFIFNDMNTRYNSIQHSTWRLHILLSGFIIATKPEDSPWTEKRKTAFNQVQASAVLEDLEIYVRNNFSALPKHDHLMLFTEYDLFGNDSGFRFNNTAGYAYIGTTCLGDGSSVSVVEDHGGFQSETTATHELGHSLGSRHDGDQNNCNSDDRYVMSGGVHPTTDANKLHPWRFSPCSEEAFDKHITKIKENNRTDCLTERVIPDNVPKVEGYPGDHVGPDEQCRQIYGPSSYLCRGTKFGGPENICLSMYCRNFGTQSSCTLNTAAPGTCCGNLKLCIEGECVDAPNSTCYMSTTCPFGQRQGVVFENQTCDQLDSGNCYFENFRQICCEMCDNQRTNIFSCEFGDKVRHCDSTLCGETLEGSGESYDVQCCGTCSYGNKETPATPAPGVTTTLPSEVPGEVEVCRDTHLLNGVPCRYFLDTNGIGFCCNASIRDVCCQSCRAIEDLKGPTCPYGNCLLNCQIILKSRVRVPCSNEERATCCETCQELDQMLTTTSSTTTSSTTTTSTTTEKKEQQEEEEEECEFLLGVRTCGARGLFPEGARGPWGMFWAVMMVMMMMMMMVVV